MLVFSLPGAPLSVSHDATRAVNLLYCRSPSEDFYEDTADDVETRFDTSGYSKEDSRPLPIGLNKKVTGLMKDELGVR